MELREVRQHTTLNVAAKHSKLGSKAKKTAIILKCIMVTVVS